jgi:hypothetical protein
MNELVFESLIFKLQGLWHKTSRSLLGPRVEVGLTPNFMKGINIFPLSIVGFIFFLFSTK